MNLVIGMMIAFSFHDGMTTCNGTGVIISSYVNQYDYTVYKVYTEYNGVVGVYAHEVSEVLSDDLYEVKVVKKEEK